MYDNRFGNDTQEAFKRRIGTVTWIIVVVMLFYLGHLFDLQVVRGSYYRRQSYDIARRATPIPARRGIIFDRNYDVPLATNRPSYAIDLIPGEVKGVTIDQIFERLASVLQVPASSLRSKLPRRILDPYAPIEVDGGLSYDTISYIAEHLEEFPGVTWHSKPIRYYPISGSISHIVGYVGDITPDELQVLYNKGYSADSIIGKDGVEEVYDKTLRGKDGERYQVVDVSGKKVAGRDTVISPPVDGDNIVLTIDRHIQKLAQEALGKRTGAIVVLRPSTGAILALASYPWYNPNQFYTKEGREDLNKDFTDPKFPFLDRGIQVAYAPASTFKIVMITADIATNALPPTQTLDIHPTLTLGGRIWHNWEPVHFPAMDLAEGFAQSNDVYFWILGGKYLGIDRIDDYAARFGFGQKTGVDLPGEVAGLLPGPEWKQDTLGRPWVGGDTLNMSIGQSYLLETPLQMADEVAMVVNKGVIYRPHVLSEVRDPVTGAVIERYHPQVLRYSGISPSVFTQVQADMRNEVKNGTANVVITTKAVKVAAKTGTGQVGDPDHYTSWFASFGPYGDPNPRDQVVVVVLVDAQNPWQWWAPKAACIVYQGIFAHQSYNQALRALSPVWWLNSSVVGNFDR